MKYILAMGLGALMFWCYENPKETKTHVRVAVQKVEAHLK